MSSRQDLRLELLRLAHRHDLPPEAIVDRAKALEVYVTDGKETSTLSLPSKRG